MLVSCLLINLHAVYDKTLGYISIMDSFIITGYLKVIITTVIVVIC